MGSNSRPTKASAQADQRLSLPNLCESKLAALPPEYLANLLMGSLPHLPPELAEKIAKHANVTATITMLGQHMAAADARREARLRKSRQAMDQKAELPEFLFRNKPGA